MVFLVGRCARAGRTGTAFSLVCSDELPYVLDLHLFLGRKINILQKNSKVKNESFEGAFGKIPSFLVEIQQSELMVWYQNDEEMVSPFSPKFYYLM